MTVLRPLFAIGALSLGLMLGVPSTSMAGEKSAQQMEASELMKASDFKGAVKLLNELTKQEPQNAGAWSMLAMSYHSMGKHKKAVKAWEQAGEEGAEAWLIAYNIGCAKAQMGDSDGAFASLETAITAGFNNHDLFMKDTDLDSLRSDARYDVMAVKVEQKASPCEFDDNYGGLDFWIGDWAVQTEKGKMLGRNQISKGLKGCSIDEKWTGKYGAGKSTSFYDPSTETWHQTWISNSGYVSQMEGVINGESIVFEGAGRTFDGKEKVVRMTLSLEDGVLTQVGQSGPNLTELVTTFEAIYYPYEDMKMAH